MNCLSLLLTVTLHLGMVGEFNEINPHLRCEVDDYFSTGIYYNSEKDVSFYISRKIILSKSNIEIGLVTGYTDAKMMPLVRWKRDNWFIAPVYSIKRFGTIDADHTIWSKGEKDFGVLIGYEMKIGKRK